MTRGFVRWSKLVMLVAGALGVLAFFLPFFVFQAGDREVPASARTLLLGFDDPQLEPLRYEQGSPDCISEVLQIDNGHVLDGHSCGHLEKHKSYVPMYFASAIIFGLVGLWSIVRRRMSGVAGLFTLPASFLALGGWLRELKLDRLTDTSHTAIGATLLGVSGILALAATVAIFIWPEPAVKKPVAKPTLPEARIVR
jgi:hypothetical protein